jgi:hypothetical protein
LDTIANVRIPPEEPAIRFTEREASRKNPIEQGGILSLHGPRPADLDLHNRVRFSTIDCLIACDEAVHGQVHSGNTPLSLDRHLLILFGFLHVAPCRVEA